MESISYNDDMPKDLYLKSKPPPSSWIDLLLIIVSVLNYVYNAISQTLNGKEGDLEMKKLDIIIFLAVEVVSIFEVFLVSYGEVKTMLWESKTLQLDFTMAYYGFNYSENLDNSQKQDISGSILVASATVGAVTEEPNCIQFGLLLFLPIAYWFIMFIFLRPNASYKNVVTISRLVSVVYLLIFSLADLARGSRDWDSTIQVHLILATVLILLCVLYIIFSNVTNQSNKSD